MCGFTHSTWVIVPLSVILVFMSKIDEGEWCAQTNPAVRKVAAETSPPKILYRKEGLLGRAWLKSTTRAEVRGSRPGSETIAASSFPGVSEGKAKSTIDKTGSGNLKRRKVI